MYKLHLLLRYLSSKALAILAVLGIAACVFLMLTSVSVMSGFLWKIEQAAKGLFGDIVVESAGLTGLSRYDEFTDEVVKRVPRVKAGSPFILGYGILRVPNTDYRHAIQIAGIRLPQRVDVSDFEKGMFVQRDIARPTFDPPMRLLFDRLIEDEDGVLAIRRRERLRIFRRTVDAGKLTPGQRERFGRLMDADVTAVTPDDVDWLSGLSRKTDLSGADAEVVLEAREVVRRINSTLSYRRRSAKRISNTRSYSEQRRKLRAALAKAREAGADADAATLAALQEGALLLDKLCGAGAWAVFPRATQNATRVSKTLVAEIKRAKQHGPSDETIDALEDCLSVLDDFLLDDPAQRAMLGLGISGLSFRTYKGETVRHVMPGNRISLLLMPLGKRFSSAMPAPSLGTFTVIDDNRSDVSSIDSKIVYLPFETLQAMNNMGPEYAADDRTRVVTPARCSQIHIKVADGITDERELREICREIQRVWKEFVDAGGPMSETEVSVVTWRQMQAKVVGPLEQQRTLVIGMNSIMWGVCVLLIIVILYVIVVQKTPDIGIVKAVGGSGKGVAGIFFGYGAVIGLIGSLIGTLSGWLFVLHINTIQDWFDAAFGFRVWDQETYMFEKIPNQVDWVAAIWIIGGAIAAGLIGALLPAIRAARMQPVEALRYE